MRLGDGQQGTDGALDILRASADPKGLAVVAKNTSQGLGHGHFDKMGILVYDAGHEILRDYGAARFLNVEKIINMRSRQLRIMLWSSTRRVILAVMSQLAINMLRRLVSSQVRGLLK